MKKEEGEGLEEVAAPSSSGEVSEKKKKKKKHKKQKQESSSEVCRVLGGREGGREGGEHCTRGLVEACKKGTTYLQRTFLEEVKRTTSL